MKKSTLVGALNGILNPVALCLGLPLLEGAAQPDFSSPTGFWGQVAIAIVIAEVLGSTSLFHAVCASAMQSFGLRPGTAAHRIGNTIFGATVLFMVIGLAEVAFTSGLGSVGGAAYPFRWLKLVIVGWPFVVVGGLLIDPLVDAIASCLCHDEVEKSVTAGLMAGVSAEVEE